MLKISKVRYAVGFIRSKLHARYVISMPCENKKDMYVLMKIMHDLIKHETKLAVNFFSLFVDNKICCLEFLHMRLTIFHISAHQ